METLAFMVLLTASALAVLSFVKPTGDNMFIETFKALVVKSHSEKCRKLLVEVEMHDSGLRKVQQNLHYRIYCKIIPGMP